MVTEAMQDLGMSGGRFEVALVKQDEPQSYGLESVEFLVAGHAGSTPRPRSSASSASKRFSLLMRGSNSATVPVGSVLEVVGAAVVPRLLS